jgi:hypothetical protein
MPAATGQDSIALQDILHAGRTQYAVGMKATLKLPPTTRNAPIIAVFRLLQAALRGLTFQHDPSGSFMAMQLPGRRRRNISVKIASAHPTVANTNRRWTRSNCPLGRPVATTVPWTIVVFRRFASAT